MLRAGNTRSATGQFVCFPQRLQARTVEVSDYYWENWSGCSFNHFTKYVYFHKQQLSTNRQMEQKKTSMWNFNMNAIYIYSPSKEATIQKRRSTFVKERKPNSYNYGSDSKGPIKGLGSCALEGFRTVKPARKRVELQLVTREATGPGGKTYGSAGTLEQGAELCLPPCPSWSSGYSQLGDIRGDPVQWADGKLIQHT